jgi:hypothetical protein
MLLPTKTLFKMRVLAVYVQSFADLRWLSLKQDFTKCATFVQIAFLSGRNSESEEVKALLR